MRDVQSLRVFIWLLVVFAVAVPAPAVASDIVLYASDAVAIKGNWAPTASSGAAGARSMSSANLGWATSNTALASPSHYFEMTFDAPAGTLYRIWLRLRAADQSKWNDGVWVQFSDATSGGSGIYRIGTNKGLLVNLERCSGCGTSGWGWQNTAYWLGQTTALSFASSGTHTVRVQIREDGVEVDQIVLSPVNYATEAPGPITNDSTILPKSSDADPVPGGTGRTPYGGTPAVVPGTIAAARFDNGGANTAYADSSSGNTGRAFRSTDVDLEAASIGGYNVGWTAPGEWLAYTVNVAASGTYMAQFRVASLGGGSMQVSFASPSGTAKSFAVPNTGAWQAWTTVSVPLTLAAGQQVMTVKFTSANINFHAVSVVAASSTPPPVSDDVITVNAGDDLQAALDAAAPGDTIVLQAGATFVGNFVLPARSGSSNAFITIRSSAADSSLPADDERITPAFASKLPKLRSPNTAPALTTAPGAHHYRVQFVEFLANANGAGTIIALGDGSSKQNTLSEVPHNLVVDRVYVHGDPSKGQRRGIALNSAATRVLNSHISDIKAADADSQAIAGWNGPGPFEIINNYLEASAENVMFGGADPKIPNLVPSDITIRRNHLRKPLIWRTQKWLVKNLLELKNAQRVVIDGNLFEQHWAAAQSGFAILLKSVNQDRTAPWSVVQDVQFTNNIVRHVAAGITIRRDPSDAIEVNGITIRNNLFDRIDSNTYGGNGWFLLVIGGSDITVDHNTVINDGTSVLVPDLYPSPGFAFTNNVVIDRGLGIKGGGAAAGTATIKRYFPGGEFFGGVYVGSDPDDYPTANFYPPTVDAVGFVDFKGGNYRLGSHSIYRNGATDGKDPGCDFAALGAAQGG
jgi:hypothetical protein